MNLFASMILQSFVRLVIYADQYYVGLAATAKDDEIMTQVKMKPSVPDKASPDCHAKS